MTERRGRIFGFGRLKNWKVWEIGIDTPLDSGNTCCISQELNIDREVGGIETLQRKAVDYHSVDNPFLMSLDAFFVKVFMKHQELCRKYCDNDQLIRVNFNWIRG